MAQSAAQEACVATEVDAVVESPAERRKRRMRDQIVGAAEEVFAAEGAGGLSMRRLAEKIDYSPAAIYKYFPSKDALIEEIREQFFDRLLRRLDQVSDAAAGAAQEMGACLRAYIECGLERPNHYRMAFEVAEDPELSAEKGSNAYEAARRLERMIMEGVEDGRYRPMPPHLAATSVWGALHGLTILMAELCEFPRADGEPTCASEIVDFHVDMIERGLAAV